MRFGILELIGLFLVVVGAGAVVAAAAMVSPALGALASGIFLLFFGALTVYVATALEKATAPKPGERP